MTAYDKIDDNENPQRPSSNTRYCFGYCPVDDDPIDLNEAPIAVSWDENKAVFGDFDPEDPDSSANENVLVDNNGTTNPEGAKIFYTISGEDKEFLLFQTSASCLSLPLPIMKTHKTKQEAASINLKVIISTQLQLR